MAATCQRMRARSGVLSIYRKSELRVKSDENLANAVLDLNEGTCPQGPRIYVIVMVR